MTHINDSNDDPAENRENGENNEFDQLQDFSSKRLLIEPRNRII